MKEIVLTQHVKDSMRSRGITAKQVRSVIAAPSHVKHQANGRIKVIGKISRRKLFVAVIYKETSRRIIVVTTHHASKI